MEHYPTPDHLPERPVEMTQAQFEHLSVADSNDPSVSDWIRQHPGLGGTVEITLTPEAPEDSPRTIRVVTDPKDFFTIVRTPHAKNEGESQPDQTEQASGSFARLASRLGGAALDVQVETSANTKPEASVVSATEFKTVSNFYNLIATGVRGREARSHGVDDEQIIKSMHATIHAYEADGGTRQDVTTLVQGLAAGAVRTPNAMLYLRDELTKTHDLTDEEKTVLSHAFSDAAHINDRGDISEQERLGAVENIILGTAVHARSNHPKLYAVLQAVAAGNALSQISHSHDIMRTLDTFVTQR